MELKPLTPITENHLLDSFFDPTTAA